MARCQGINIKSKHEQQQQKITTITLTPNTAQIPLSRDKDLATKMSREVIGWERPKKFPKSEWWGFAGPYFFCSFLLPVLLSSCLEHEHGLWVHLFSCDHEGKAKRIQENAISHHLELLKQNPQLPATGNAWENNMPEKEKSRFYWSHFIWTVSCGRTQTPPDRDFLPL